MYTNVRSRNCCRSIVRDTLPAIAENSVARIYSIKIYLCRRIRNVSCFQKNMFCNLIYVIEVFFTEFRLILVS